MEWRRKGFELRKQIAKEIDLIYAVIQRNGGPTDAIAN